MADRQTLRSATTDVSKHYNNMVNTSAQALDLNMQNKDEGGGLLCNNQKKKQCLFTRC